MGQYRFVGFLAATSVAFELSANCGGKDSAVGLAKLSKQPFAYGCYWPLVDWAQ